MKKIMMKRISAIMMAATMAVICCFTNYTTAFAASETKARPTMAVSASDMAITSAKHVEEIEISTNMFNDGGRLLFNLRDDDDDDEPEIIDQTFYFTNYHRGADRSYDADTIALAFKITDSNGAAINNQVAITFQDYWGTELVYYVDADGGWHGNANIAIVPNRTYYLTYENLTSTTTQLRARVMMIIG